MRSCGAGPSLPAIITITTGSSYLSASNKRVHFGLGDAAHASVEVFWPSGARQVLKEVSADQFLTVEEPRQP